MTIHSFSNYTENRANKKTKYVLILWINPIINILITNLFSNTTPILVCRKPGMEWNIGYSMEYRNHGMEYRNYGMEYRKYGMEYMEKNIWKR